MGAMGIHTQQEANVVEQSPQVQELLACAPKLLVLLRQGLSPPLPQQFQACARLLQGGLGAIRRPWHSN